jgi:host factor-I protein
MGKIDLQKEFLTGLMEKELPARIITKNGFQMTGRLLGFDRYIILMQVDGVRHLVYKGAVSTIREGG